MASITPEQLRATVVLIRNATHSGMLAWGQMDRLITRIERQLDQSEPLNPPLTQAETDRIVATYLPMYQNILSLIEQAGDALGTDNF